MPHSIPARRAHRIAAIAGAAALALGAAAPAAAHAAPVAVAAPDAVAATGAIDGVVTGAADAPLADVFVQLQFCDPDFDPTAQVDCWTLLYGDGADALTGADGAFAIAGLEPGDYRVGFTPRDSASSYIREYWDGAEEFADAEVVEVAAGAATTIAPTLEVGATISGTVVDGAGAPVAGGYVYAYLGDDPSTRGGASVASDGSYAIVGLPTGDYVLEAGPAWGADVLYVREWWQDARTRDAATPLAIEAGDALAADWVLDAGAVVEGGVTAGGAAAPGIDVAVFAKEGEYWREAASAETDAAGAYRVDGLEQGDYVVRFADFDGELAFQHWPGVVARADAELLALSPGDVASDVDAALTPGGSIAGTITETADGATAPSAGGYLDVLRRDAEGDLEVVTSATAAADGAFSVSGLAPGDYTVQGLGSPSGSWAWRYHGGAYYADEAVTVPVAASVAATGVDVELERAVSISGRFTDAAGAPVDEVDIEILLERDGEWVAPPPGGGAGDVSYYNRGALPPGRYIVGFVASDGAAEPIATQYWQQAATRADATVLDGTAGGRFEGIDFVLEPAAG
jgi:hypothetical protein